MRVRLFNKEFPNGKLFTDAKELAEAEKSGLWVDAQWKVNEGTVADKAKVKAEREDKIVEDYITEMHGQVMSDPKLCECGCGTEVKPDKRFAPGHYQKWLKGKKNGSGTHGKQTY